MNGNIENRKAREREGERDISQESIDIGIRAKYKHIHAMSSVDTFACGHGTYAVYASPHNERNQCNDFLCDLPLSASLLICVFSKFVRSAVCNFVYVEPSTAHEND